MSVPCQNPTFRNPDDRIPVWHTPSEGSVDRQAPARSGVQPEANGFFNHEIGRASAEAATAPGSEEEDLIRTVATVKSFLGID